jgi:hypothetical protein
VFTIYDWKESQPIVDVTQWHIGGRDDDAVRVVNEIVNESLGERAPHATRFEIY